MFTIQMPNFARIKLLVTYCIVFCWATTSFGQPLYIVSPAGLETIPGNSYDSAGAITPFSGQHLHSAFSFDALLGLSPAHHWLIGGAFRPDESVEEPIVSRARMVLSFSVTDKISLDMDFAANRGHRFQTVFDGEWIFETNVDGPPGNNDVHAFDYILWFQEPYQYNPAEGSLLTEFRSSSGFSVGIGYRADAEVMPEITDVLNWGDSDAEHATHALYWLPVTQFIFAAPGDFNADLTVAAADIDLLTREIVAGTNSPRFDLNDDRLVNHADHLILVRDELNTWIGDVNLDGLFDSSDLVATLSVGEYEDSAVGNSTWATGDWNGDLEFDSADLVAAFADGGYEVGPRPAAVVVPEPLSLAPMATGLAGWALLSSRRRKKRYGVLVAHPFLP